MKNPDRRNKYFFGLGTIGRDMFYAFEANALLYFLSNILSLPIHVFAAVSLVLSVLRIADAPPTRIAGLNLPHFVWILSMTRPVMGSFSASPKRRTDRTSPWQRK